MRLCALCSDSLRWDGVDSVSRQGETSGVPLAGNLALPPKSVPWLPFLDTRAAETKEMICRSNFERKRKCQRMSLWLPIASLAIAIASDARGFSSDRDLGAPLSSNSRPAAFAFSDASIAGRVDRGGVAAWSLPAATMVWTPIEAQSAIATVNAIAPAFGKNFCVHFSSRKSEVVL